MTSTMSHRQMLACSPDHTCSNHKLIAELESERDQLLDQLGEAAAILFDMKHAATALHRTMLAEMCEIALQGCRTLLAKHGR